MTLRGRGSQAAGAVLTGAGLLLVARIHVGDRYLATVLPSLAVFGVGLAALITPITATVLASVDQQHCGIASAVNNALSRLGQMIAVAALPLAAGLSGAAFTNPAAMAAGFPTGPRSPPPAACPVNQPQRMKPGGPEPQRTPYRCSRASWSRCS